MDNFFQAGNKVKLKSGDSPEMTIDSIIKSGNLQGQLICIWFDDGELKNKIYAPEALEHAESDEK